MAALQARLGILRLNAGRLNSALPDKPPLLSPPHQSIGGPFTLNWNPAAGAQSYHVYFGTTNPPPFVTTVVGTSWALPGLASGARYYWRIDAQSSFGVRTGDSPYFDAAKPAAPALYAPADGAIDQATNPELWWYGVTNVSDASYGVAVGPTPSHKPYVAWTANNHTTVGPLQGGATYYWHVLAWNNAGSSQSVTWRFSVLSPTKLVATIAGVRAETRIRVASFSIRDIQNAPNTASFTVDGTAPTVAQEVRMGLGTLNAADIVFGGVIDTVEALYEGRPANRAWRVTCQDYTWGLNRRKVRRRYGQQPAHLIASDLLARYAPSNYTGAHIVAPLPTVDGGIDFTEEDLTVCFARLAQRIGGYWYVDYQRDVHLFVTETTEPPEPIAEGGRVLLNDPPIAKHLDLTQVRTRVYVEGGGSQARFAVAPGAAAIPIVDAGWYAPAGIVTAGPQRITYTGKGAAGGPSAPSAAVIAAVGTLDGGPYSYKYAHVAGAAEGALSAASNIVSIGGVAAPVGPMTTGSVASTGGNIPAGTHWYACVFVTAVGETQAGAWQNVFVPSGSTNKVTLANVPISSDPRVVARRIYRHNAGWPGDLYYLDGEIADNATTTYVSTKADNALGAQLTDTYTAGYLGQIGVTAIAVGPGGTTARRLYRTEAGGGTYKLVATINDNTTTSYTDNKADAALGAIASGESQTELTGIPASGAGAILYDILAGDEINLVVQCDDVAAQADLASIEGAPSDGVIEHFIQDRRLGLSQASATGTADLALFSRPIARVQYASRDRKTRAGKTVSINLPTLDLVGLFVIQTVEIDEVDIAPGLLPRFRVTASSVKFSLEDVIRRLQLEPL